MTRKKIVIISFLIVFVLFLVGCPGPTEKVNEYGFYDGYYVYRTEVYIADFYDRNVNYNENNYADGEVLNLTSNSYIYKRINIKLIRNYNLFKYNCKIDLTSIIKAYALFQNKIEESSNLMILIDEYQNVFVVDGIISFVDSNQDIVFFKIDLYERINNTDYILETINQDNSITLDEFIGNISPISISTFENFIDSNLYKKYKDIMLYRVNNYYIKIENHFVFQIYNNNDKLISELLFIKDNAIIESVKNYDCFEAFLQTNIHKLYIETNNVIINDIVNNNSNIDNKYYQFKNIKSLKDYCISKKMNDVLIIIEKPSEKQILSFIKTMEELIFVRYEENIKLNDYGMYTICIDNYKMLMNILNERYYIIFGEYVYEIINPTRDFVNMFDIFTDYRYW